MKVLWYTEDKNIYRCDLCYKIIDIRCVINARTCPFCKNESTYSYMNMITGVYDTVDEMSQQLKCVPGTIYTMRTRKKPIKGQIIRCVPMRKKCKKLSKALKIRKLCSDYMH